MTLTFGSPPPYFMEAQQIVFRGFDGLPPDTICVDRPQYVRLFIKGEQSRAFEEQRDLLLMANDTLKARIAIKEMQITNLNGQISNYRDIIASKDAIISTQGEQRKIWEANIESLNKEVKRQKRGKKITAIIGLVTTGITTYLLIKR